MRNKNFDKFLLLREKYPDFTYKGFDYRINQGALKISFHFSIPEKYDLYPSMVFEAHSVLFFSKCLGTSPALPFFPALFPYRRNKVKNIFQTKTYIYEYQST